MQGFNMGRYYPPDTDHAPSFNNASHPLGHRAKKINQGILTVRFELPFAVWCQHCKPEAIVGQGVRFNAEKKKVGNYYSTPIWSFRMKHSACGGWWEIRTDPKNAAYVVVDGARKRDYGPDDVPKGEGELAFLTEEEREKRRNDAFASLEGKIDEKGLETKNKKRVEELYEHSQVWEDPYTANQKLRRDFRVQRKFLEKEGRAKEGIQDKFSFGYDIADELESDKMRAKLVDFGTKGSDEVLRKPLFKEKSEVKAVEVKPKTKKLKAEIRAEKSRKDLQSAIIGNTRATNDPFLMDTTRTEIKSSLGLLKRKRDQDPKTVTPNIISTIEPPPTTREDRTATQRTTLTAALVGYESD